MLSDYKNLVEEWPLKPTIEEPMAAFKEAQEMKPRAMLAEECLGLLSDRQPRSNVSRALKCFSNGSGGSFPRSGNG